MRNTVLKTLVLAGILLFGTSKKVRAQVSLFDKNIYASKTGDSLPYRFFSPDYNTTNRKYPLVIFLHGSGERGNNNEAQLKWGVMNFVSNENMRLHPTYILAPQCPENLTWDNIELNGKNKEHKLAAQPSLPMKLLIELIKECVQKYPIDTNRIYITGLSMGGYGTFDALERYPNLFAAAVPVCGGGDTSKAKLFAHVPIWIFHGAEDGAVPTSHSQNMLKALTDQGAYPGYTQFPEIGHFSWNAAYSNDLMMEWLFKQTKKP